MSPDDPVPPMAAAMQWVGRIFGVVAAMVLPGLGGGWLDRRWGVGFLAPLGLIVGLVAGMAYLIGITRRNAK